MSIFNQIKYLIKINFRKKFFLEFFDSFEIDHYTNCQNIQQSSN